jgi:hypothetical protein
MPRLSRCLAFIALVSLPPLVQDYAAAADHAAELQTALIRAQHLKRGINASQWFAQSAMDYSAARTILR